MERVLTLRLSGLTRRGGFRPDRTGNHLLVTAMGSYEMPSSVTFWVSDEGVRYDGSGGVQYQRFWGRPIPTVLGVSNTHGSGGVRYQQ